MNPHNRIIILLLPNYNEHHKIEMEQFIAVKELAEASPEQLVDPEENNLNKVKAVEDDNEDEKDESLPVVEILDLVNKAKLKIAETICDSMLPLAMISLY